MYMYAYISAFKDAFRLTSGCYYIHKDIHVAPSKPQLIALVH